MIKSMSVMRDVEEVCDTLRHKLFGENASRIDYKDSYVMNTLIHNFAGHPADLMAESITQRDRQPKTSKSINFRSDCFLKLSTLSETLGIPDSEVLRRIIYYMLNEETSSANRATAELSDLKEKVIRLKEHVAHVNDVLNEVMLAINLMENQEDRS